MVVDYPARDQVCMKRLETQVGPHREHWRSYSMTELQDYRKKKRLTHTTKNLYERRGALVYNIIILYANDFFCVDVVWDDFYDFGNF